MKQPRLGAPFTTLCTNCGNFGHPEMWITKDGGPSKEPHQWLIYKHPSGAEVRCLATNCGDIDDCMERRVERLLENDADEVEIAKTQRLLDAARRGDDSAFSHPTAKMLVRAKAEAKAKRDR